MRHAHDMLEGVNWRMEQSKENMSKLHHQDCTLYQYVTLITNVGLHCQNVLYAVCACTCIVQRSIALLNVSPQNCLRMPLIRLKRVAAI